MGDALGEASRRPQGGPGGPHGPGGDHAADAPLLLDGGHAGVASQNAGDHAAGLEHRPGAAQHHEQLGHPVEHSGAHPVPGEEYQVAADDQGDDEVKAHGDSLSHSDSYTEPKLSLAIISF